MASVAVSNITNITRQISGGKGGQLSLGGLPVEVFRIASGQATGDTAALTPQNINNIRSCFAGPFTHNATAASGASTVTITLVGGTSTMGSFEVYVVGPVNTSN